MAEQHKYLDSFMYREGANCIYSFTTEGLLNQLGVLEMVIVHSLT